MSKVESFWVAVAGVIVACDCPHCGKAIAPEYSGAAYHCPECEEAWLVEDEAA